MRIHGSAGAVGRVRVSRWLLLLAAFGAGSMGLGSGLGAGALEAQTHAASTRKPACYRAVLEGDVKAGQGFDAVFTKGLRFYLEPLRSGWIVRVLAVGEPRGPHDYAELATPPYQSVSPLLVSTDWSFRAQDALGWNPRRFRYAADRSAFDELAALYGKIMANDGASEARAAELASQQPEGVLEILDARIVPGLADQAQTAAMVASHFAETPHSVEQNGHRSPLGKLEEMRFRVELNLRPGDHAAKGVSEKPISCEPRPTAGSSGASQH